MLVPELMSSGVPVRALQQTTPISENKARKKRMTGVEESLASFLAAPMIALRTKGPKNAASAVMRA